MFGTRQCLSLVLEVEVEIKVRFGDGDDECSFSTHDQILILCLFTAESVVRVTEARMKSVHMSRSRTGPGVSRLLLKHSATLTRYKWRICQNTRDERP